MQEIVAGKMLRLQGVVGIYPANAVDDDIGVYANEERQQVGCRFFGLRQQAEKEKEDEPYIGISDFIAPKASDIPDTLGCLQMPHLGLKIR